MIAFALIASRNGRYRYRALVHFFKRPMCTHVWAWLFGGEKDTKKTPSQENLTCMDCLPDEHLRTTFSACWLIKCSISSEKLNF